MTVCGVICEYNPFHLGHALHLAQARALSGADYVVCVMSGPVVQRGAFARHDKRLRARMALLSGADLVLELPVRFACAPAPEFARGGISLLSGLGVVTHLSFGCEPSALPVLRDAARILADETPAFTAALREGLCRGLSYPRARALAAEQSGGIPGLSALLAQPNAALALEYLAALPEGIVPVPVAREGADYHDAALAPLSSATAVRAALAAGQLDEALAAVPCPQLLRQAEETDAVHPEEALTQALLYRLRTMDADELAAIAGMDEGLHNRFLAAAKHATTRDGLILAVKSKRYTYARLSRIAANILLGVTGAFARAHEEPTYARVLGFRRSAAPLLSHIKKRAVPAPTSEQPDQSPSPGARCTMLYEASHTTDMRAVPAPTSEQPDQSPSPGARRTMLYEASHTTDMRAVPAPTSEQPDQSPSPGARCTMLYEASHTTDMRAVPAPTSEQPDQSPSPGARRTMLYEASHTINKSGSLPLVTGPAGIDDPLLRLDVRAQDLWALGCRNPALRQAGQDYTAGPVIVD